MPTKPETPPGCIVSGIQDALNEDNTVTSLMSRGLMVLSLQKKAVAGRSRKKTWTVKETDLVLFTRQLATMIDAGISLVQGLTALYDQSDPKRECSLRHVVSDVTTRVQGGETFHESIAKHPRVFNRLFVSMVKAGDNRGLCSGHSEAPQGAPLPIADLTFLRKRALASRTSSSPKSCCTIKNVAR